MRVADGSHATDPSASVLYNNLQQLASADVRPTIENPAHCAGSTLLPIGASHAFRHTGLSDPSGHPRVCLWAKGSQKARGATAAWARRAVRPGTAEWQQRPRDDRVRLRTQLDSAGLVGPFATFSPSASLQTWDHSRSVCV